MYLYVFLDYGISLFFVPKLTVFSGTICRRQLTRQTISCSFSQRPPKLFHSGAKPAVTGCRECPSFTETLCWTLSASEMDNVMSCDEAALCSWPGSSRGHKRAASDMDDKEVEKPSKHLRTAGCPPRESSHCGDPGDLSGLPEMRRMANVMPCDAASCSGISCGSLRRSSNEASGEEDENLSEILRSAECPSRESSHPDHPGDPPGPPETAKKVVSCDEASCSNNCGSNVGTEMDSRETKNPNPAGTFSPSSDLIDPAGLQETTEMEICTLSDAPSCSGNRASNSERDSNETGNKETENPSIPFGSAGCSPCTSFNDASGRTRKQWKPETEDDASHDTCCWSWACSSSPSSSTISVSSGITVSSSSCCTLGTASPSRSCCSRESFNCEGDSPSKSSTCDHPDGPVGLQETVTENLASCSTASCGMNVDQPAGQQESAEAGNQSSCSQPCCCADGDSNEKAVGGVDDKMVRKLPTGFPPAESSLWKSFINPSDPSGLRLILQRIPAPVANSEDRNCPDPFKTVQNGGKTETEDVTGNQPCCSGTACGSGEGGAFGDENAEVRKQVKCSEGDSNDPTNVQKENELEAVVSSDACSCSWCCNSSCSSSSNSSNSVDDSCKEAAGKVDEKEVDAPSSTFDKTGSSRRESSASNDSGDPTALQEVEDTSSQGSATSCNSCLSGFARAAMEMDERAAGIPSQCPGDASSDSWTDTELDGYSELLPSLRYS